MTKVGSHTLLMPRGKAMFVLALAVCALKSSATKLEQLRTLIARGTTIPPSVTAHLNTTQAPRLLSCSLGMTSKAISGETQHPWNLQYIWLQVQYACVMADQRQSCPLAKYQLTRGS